MLWTSQKFGSAWRYRASQLPGSARMSEASQLLGSARMRSGCHSPEMTELQTGITFDWDVRFRRSLWRWNRNEKCYLKEVGFLEYNSLTNSCFGNGESIDPGISVQHLSVSILDLTLSHCLYSSNVICIFNFYLRENFWYNYCPPKSAFMDIKRALNIATLLRSTRPLEFLFVDS